MAVIPSAGNSLRGGNHGLEATEADFPGSSRHPPPPAGNEVARY